MQICAILNNLQFIYP